MKMFAPLNAKKSYWQRMPTSASLLLHGIVFAWLLRSPQPLLLNPSSVAVGHNGRVLTQLYFPTPLPDDSDSNSSQRATQIYRHQRLGHEKLIFKQDSLVAKGLVAPSQLARASVEDKSDMPTLSKRGHGTSAGLPYGSLPGGPIYGDEVRPALPVSTVDPVIYPWELPDAEGNVVVEITIDERGVIVSKTVIRSMGSKLDEKFLAALDSWHFQPAMRNGTAIASKQDAIFHYRARG
jgi:TonB family protein